MRNKILFSIALLLIAATAFAGISGKAGLPFANMSAIGGVPKANVSDMAGQALPVSGSPLGTWNFLWSLDHPTNTLTAYTSGGDATMTLLGTISASTAQNNTAGGAYSLTGIGGNNYYAAITNNGYVSAATGYVKISFYPTSLTSDITLFEYYYDGDNYIQIFWDVSGTAIRINRQGTATGRVNDNTTTVNLNAWNTTEVRWSTSEDSMSSRTNGGSWSTPTTGLTALASEPTLVKFGEHLTAEYGGAASVDDMYLSTSYTGGTP